MYITKKITSLSVKKLTCYFCCLVSAAQIIIVLMVEWFLNNQVDSFYLVRA